MMKKLIIFCLLTLISGTSFAQTQKRIPFYASLKSNETNVRTGPGLRYPILWVYKKKEVPILIMRKYQNWYEIRDMEGEEGWVHKNLVSRTRYVSINEGLPAVLYKDNKGLKPIARLEQGVVGKLGVCDLGQCQIMLTDLRGWVAKGRLHMLEIPEIKK